MMLTYDELVATEVKIAKINERAQRRGFTGRLTLTSERVEVTARSPLGFDVTEIGYQVTIGGDAPRYAGWRFVATLAWDAEAGLITRVAPGVAEVNIDRSTLRAGWCDHCKLNRHRTDTYLLINDEGRQVQVGSTCIKDFLGWTGRPVFLSVADVQADVEETLRGGGFGEHRWSVDTILAVSWAVVQAYGFVPASSYTGTSTKSIVLDVLDSRSAAQRELARDLAPYVDKAAAQATIIREFILSDDFAGGGEYVANLKAVARADSASARNVGLLASAPQAWARAQERTLRRQRERAELVNEWVGNPRDKIQITATVRSVRFIEGQWGTTTVYTLVGDTGHVFTWFSSNGALGDETDRTIFTLTGTVKAHEEYRGTKSTALTRCKVISERKPEGA